MHKLPQLLRQCRLDNRGAGFVSVLVAMMVVSLLGTTLLYTSYTAVQIKMTERIGKQTFYHAASAMSELQAGLQEVVSDAIDRSYREVMVHYSKAFSENENYDMTTAFQKVFRKHFFAWQYETPDKEKKALFHDFSGKYVYQLETLQSFLSKTQGVVLETIADANNNAIYQEDKQQIVLKGIRLSYTNPKGDTDMVSTDFVIQIPAFSYLFSEYNSAGLPEFAVVARGTFQQTGTQAELDIEGSAYAGKVDLSSQGQTLSLKNGTLICKGDFTVTGVEHSRMPRFSLSAGAGLWADGLVLKQAAKVELAGACYVADDLSLDGIGAEAVISGQYYGFGDSTTDANKSSAILVNAKDTKLNLAKAKQLMLAGHSFISEGTSSMMGESISVRSNQQLYLIPAEELRQVNPQIHSNPLLLPNGEDIPTASLALGTGRTIQTIVKPIPGTGQKVCYYFMGFQDSTQANAYFKEKFAQNPAKISDYLRLYTELSIAEGSLRTAGYTLIPDPNKPKEYILANVSEPNALGNTTAMQGMFQNMCKTLLPIAVNTSAQNPYDYFVNVNQINTAFGKVEKKQYGFQNDTGDTVAMLYTGDYTVNEDTPDTVCLILATGNITVKRDRFQGLMMAGGDVTIEGSVKALSAQDDQVMRALSAKQQGTDRMFYDFLNVDISSEQSSQRMGAENSWNPDTLVSVAQWREY